jgi:hypothetical protein
MKRARIFWQSLLIAVGTGTLLVSPAQGSDWFAVPGYDDGYYDSERARRPSGDAGRRGQGTPRGERGRRPAAAPPPPPRRRPDAWSEDRRTYPERWRGNPYWGSRDPWYGRDRYRWREREYRDWYERDQYRRWRKLMRSLDNASDP